MNACVVLARDDQVKEGCGQALCTQSARELGAHDEEPARCPASGWLPAEEHGSDEGHLVKIPEIQATMRELTKEVMKAGVTEDMLEDTFESIDDQEEMEEETKMETDKILFEITAGASGKTRSKVTDALPESAPPGAMAASKDEEEEEALQAMQSWLATLHS
ncbi:Charged multivesicular body protein 3 [Tupaia chinensis]|uniref:Charged multivesicular body protein 3 n=1 Tax=Tupaia chinensis TaxID=246437 RepID=L9KHY7_TUPCH|nr:Charged multivesicular body protein 3 [Tupaia chinensis]